MRLRAYTTLLFLCFSLILMAQPANDECINAIELTDVTSWCSNPAEFTNQGSTPSAVPNPTCFPNNQTVNDVWFSFVAEATAVNISVTGATAVTTGGTLRNPQYALYSGDCNNLTAVGCASDAMNENFVQAFAGPLNIGETYYIRVSARFGFMGTFKLCVNNYNEVPQPSGDCPTGVILCDKSAFTVDFVTGIGSVNNEIGNVGCNAATCDIEESSSSWYKWTCKDAGTLTFSLTPLNLSDDLDFVVYELPNGIDNCSGKVPIRCMASGENVGQPLATWIACVGATGLQTGQTDVNETCGCAAGSNNFISPINMVAGRSYALVINNFSNSGSGFSVEFGGTGTFLGPEANFSIAPQTTVCVGEPVTLTDMSTFSGTLVGWSWNFGSHAFPANASVRGPHTVVFDRPGLKSITLTVESDRGCLVTKILTVLVECCDDHFDVNAAITNTDCPSASTGGINLSVTNNYGPYAYQWSNGPSTQDISGVQAGPYTVTITDEATCQTVETFTVGGPPPFAFDTLVTKPTCGGGVDGAVTLVVSGGTPPYQYNWQNTGFTSNNTLSNIMQGDYPVTIRDQNNCTVSLVLPVRELELVLDPTVQAITRPSCFGFSDGSIVVVIDNGLGPFQYNWNDGNGFVNENSLLNISAGTYEVEVRDANLCAGFFEFILEDYPPLALEFDTRNITCNGESDGRAAALVSGGTGVYAYAWSNNQTGSAIDQVPAGTYLVTVTDSNGCVLSGDTVLTEPPLLVLTLGDIVNNICYGESEGSISVSASGGTPLYEYSISGSAFQMEPLFDNLFASPYIITVMDAFGCTDTIHAEVTQPVELIVDAGPNQFIQLGYSTRIIAVANYDPVMLTWTPSDFLSCTNCPNPEANPVNTTTYRITAINEAGCIGFDDVTIFVVKDRPVYIPNAISPNGDGINDGFTLFTGPAANRIQSLKIFNRWGGLIYIGKDFPPNEPSLGWDGTFNGEPVNSGVFVYLAEVEFIDGEVVEYKGDVTVVR
ncbi:MAG: gliding motility-associated C-terminal domain-containing protein [Saprospiraceae bacterium]|nr:gliding motility-associated C-terminal domain-containing protein [Saprospiraceae bacterium]